MRNYWDLVARSYEFRESPLRASKEDARIMAATVRQWHAKFPGRKVSAFLFGVTPAIANMRWPKGTCLTAVEQSQAMIEHVWPGDAAGRRRAICENWFHLEVADHSVDVAIGDGFLNTLSFPKEFRTMGKLISRRLRADGLLVCRVYLRPSRRETVDGVIAGARANRIEGFETLRLRLAMALQKNPGEGIVVKEIYEAWKRVKAECPGLVERRGWRRQTVETIKLYEGQTGRYTFPTITEFRRAMARYFDEVSVTFPKYEMGEQCPIFVFRTRR
jgi:hypothetical protein